MKVVGSKKGKIIVAVIILLMLVFYGVYSQTTMEKLFYTIDISKTTKKDIESKFKFSAFIHRYHFKERLGNLTLFSEERVSSNSLTFTEGVQMVLNNDGEMDRTGNITEENLEYIYEGVTYESALDTLGTPTSIFKDIGDNRISMIGWNGPLGKKNSKSLLLMFDEEGKCFDITKKNIE